MEWINEKAKTLKQGAIRAMFDRANTMTGVISLGFTGCDNADATWRLEREHGVLTRCGLHCAPAAHRSLGSFPEGSVRFSIGWANTEADIDAALEAIAEI